MSKIIGIDLGTTNSCVSVLEGGVAKIITNAEGGRTTPSVVAFKDGERLVGEAAKRQAVTNPQTVFSIKSKMGYREKIKLDNKLYSPQEVSAMILQTLKTRAEEYLGEQVMRAVITVPAYFTDAQRQATKDAGRIAGLKVDRIINEPTAAALAYGLDKTETNQTVLVFDLGGGTFDVSILELDHGLFEVKSTAGDNKLGGDDFDKAIVDYLVHHFKEENGIDLETDALAIGRLREAAEKAKCELSGLKTTQINLPFLTSSDSGPLHLDYILTRAKFQELTQHLIDKLEGPTKQALKDAGLSTKDLDRVILVGGSTRMPAVVDLVKTLTGKEPYKGVNPDEVVAMGAAIQGGIINGEVEDLVLIDVTSLSLGIKTSGGIFTTIIPRNTSIPTTESKTFTTAVDNQSTVEIQVLQGERALAADNKVLGHFQLANITPAPAGVPQIEVTFSINRNGIVSVNAKDVLSGKNQTVIMSSDSGLSEEEIASMVKDAETNAILDEQKRKEAELLNDSQYLVMEANKLLNSDRDFISTEQIELVKSLLEKVDMYIKGNNILELDKISSDLKYTINDIMIQKYQSQDIQDEEQS